MTALFKTGLEKQRMNSVHIRSNMRHLGRIGLFVKTIKKFLRNLKRHHRTLFDSLGRTLNRNDTTRHDGPYILIAQSPIAN
ncbi:MAG: hypothetical protein DSY90_11635 [Deltaproteobacteria bacterium]|nr:MAG: hypothetical protein DSY90_11635 [Deltaproteobacteria bacterium]